MPITANTLYRDTMNFTRNQFITILMMSLLTAFITVILNQAFAPGSEELQTLNNAGGDLFLRRVGFDGFDTADDAGTANRAA